MNQDIYRAREAEAQAALDAAADYQLTAHATARGALRAIDLDGAQALMGQSGGWIALGNAAAVDLAGNQAAAEFAEALAQRDAPDPNDDPYGRNLGLDRDAWLREMLHQAGGLVGGYL